MIYFLEEHQFNLLKTVQDKLFGDGSVLTPDERRDLANIMALILNQVSNQKFGEPK